MKGVLYLFLFSLAICASCTVANEDNEKIECLDQYIKRVSSLEVYSDVRQGLIDSMADWKRRNLEFKHCNPVCGILDSAVFFNKNYSRCIFLLIERSPAGKQEKWNFVKTFGGMIDKGKWHYYHISFPVFGYNLKSNNYKDLSVEYLSRNARLDIISKGFFKEGTCEIDSDFPSEKEWFPGWVMDKHELFLKGE